MTENKRGLRIAAGIVLIAQTLFSIIVILLVSTMVSYKESFLELYGISLIYWLSSIAVAVFILCRRFTAAWIAECVYALSFLLFIGELVFRFDELSAANFTLSLIGRLVGLAEAALIITALIKKNRDSKKLLLIAAALTVVSSVLLTISTSVDEFGYSGFAELLGTVVGGLVGAASNAVPWFLLALYFGEQFSFPQYSAALKTPQPVPQSYVPTQGYVPPRGGAQNSYIPPQQYPGRYDHPGDNGQN